MSRPEEIPNQRRADLHLALAALIALAAAAGLLATAGGEPEPLAPPPLPAALALNRPDGGQALSSNGRLQPNELTELNLGRRIRLDTAHPELLGHLPGLGRRSAARAIERGCLTSRPRQNLTGMVIERCDPNSP